MRPLAIRTFLLSSILALVLSIGASSASAAPGDGALGQTKIPLPILIEGHNLIVRAQAGMGSLAREVAKASPRFLKEISGDLRDLDVPKRIEIRLVHKASSLPNVAPPGHSAPSWAAGVAYSQYGVVSVAHASGTEINSVLAVTAHELSHLALGAALHDRAPRWLNEGFAYIHSSEWSIARVQVLTGMAWSGNTIPLADLDSSFPAAEIEVHKAYAQSYDFVAFLARRGRYIDKKDEGDRWPFRNFLAHIAAGQSTDDAARRAYGANLTSLYGEWYEDLRSRYMIIPASLFGLFVWSFAALLLVIAYWRKSRQAKRILAIWEAEERCRILEVQNGSPPVSSILPSELST
ncbi:MAG: hypothetical protein GY811_24250 [Myxococcales bacterium]|nr:hypothetical protein [Myxococcales bacterium]